VGYPAAGVRPVPGDEPEIAALVERIPFDPSGRAAELAAALRDPDYPLAADPAAPGPGHLCVTAWVFDAAGHQVLLVRHRTLGWVQPGGHLDPSERPDAGAARELAEETGLHLEPGPVPTVLHPAIFPARGDEPAHVHWNLGYRFVADPSSALTPEPGAPVAWFPVDDLPRPTTADVAPLVEFLCAQQAP
jgi:8-oxo-dGTP pyrophosphatase MutT (NUDIX family)